MALQVYALTPTVDASPDYSTGDVMGGVNDFAEAGRYGLMGHGVGYIVSVAIKSKADITVPIDVVFFNSNPSNTTWTENSAVALDAADVAKLIGFVTITSFSDLGTPVVGFAECRIAIQPADANPGHIYAVMIARGTINLASTSDITLEIAVDQN